MVAQNQYQLWLGGTPALPAARQSPIWRKCPWRIWRSTLEPLLVSWKEAGGRRSFGDHVNKIGDQAVTELIGASA